MEKYDEIKKELEALIETGVLFVDSLIVSRNPVTGIVEIKDYIFFTDNYEQWYSRAIRCVKVLLPERFDDFCALYKNEKRNAINIATYTISDALKGIANGRHCGPGSARKNVSSQLNMLKACLESFDSKIINIQQLLQYDIFDDEVQSAKHLLSKGFLRASGAICGVVIEKHLSIMCDNRGFSINKKNPTISDYNDILKDQAYDIVAWRRIQHLGDIRNLCDHNKDREPTKDEIEDLMSGVEWLLGTII